MGNVSGVDKKEFTWVIKNFSSLQSEKIYSDEFVVGGCKWRLSAYPKGKNVDYLSLYLEVADYKSLPIGWRRRANFSFKIVHYPDTCKLRRGCPSWFDQKVTSSGFRTMIHLTKLHDKYEGFVRNGEVTIVAEIEVLEVIGKLDVLEESEETTKSLNKLKVDDDYYYDSESSDFLEEDSSVKESIDVNGFQILPSQVESVRRVFERHPDIAVEFRGKNQLLRKACMNFLLSLIEMLCQTLEELTNEDLVEADIALTYLKDANFKVDWLEKKLSQVKEKKEKEVSELARLQEIEENLMKLKLKCSELDVLAEKQKAELSATRTPLSFDDVV